MFVTLLLVTLVVSLATAALVVGFFRAPIGQILDRIIGETIAEGWKKFLVFALFVVGVSNGVQFWKLEQYLRPDSAGPGVIGHAFTLSASAIALEVYRTVILVLQGLAWALLLFFTIALVAFAILRRGEMRAGPSPRSAP
jgi:MFS family permease